MTPILRPSTALALVLAAGAFTPAHAATTPPALPYGSTIGNDVTATPANATPSAGTIGAGAMAQGSVGHDDLHGSLTSDDTVTADTVSADGVSGDSGDGGADATSNPRAAHVSRRAPAPPGSDAGGWGGGGAGSGDTVFAQTYNGGKRLTIRPYIEAAQIVDATFTAPSDVMTYSMLAVGGDATINGRNNQGVVSVRYERRFGESGDNNGAYGSGSGDIVSGIAHLTSAIVPGTLRIDAGGFATRTNVSGSGAVLARNGNDSTQVYAGYIGPALSTHVGAVAVDGHYHVGYDSVDNPGFATNGTTTTSTGATVTVPNMIDQNSFVQDARLAASTRPGDVLPIGLGAEGGYYSEHINVLDQKLLNVHGEGKVFIPVSDTTQIIGGIGYEDVKVTNRDAVRDASGDPVLSGNGQYVTNMASPEAIAFDTSGLIWDVGVIWRPGPRTYFEGHVGKRYGEIGGWGVASYVATSKLSFNAQVFDAMSGFGGGLENSLFTMPTQFSVLRDPITGNVTGCVGTQGAVNCIGGGLSTITAAVRRARGFSANMVYDSGPVQMGVGFGYTRNTYIGAPGTVLADINGDYDATWWASAYLSGRIDRLSSYQITVQGYHYRTDTEINGDVTGGYLTGTYAHNFTPHLTGSASLSIDEISQQALADEWGAAGALAMRYNF